jgi:hypothetical protein
MTGPSLLCSSSCRLFAQSILTVVRTKLSPAALEAVKEAKAQRLKIDDFVLNYSTGGEWP